MIYRKLTFETAREAYDFFDKLSWRPGAQVIETSVFFFEGFSYGHRTVPDTNVPYSRSANVFVAS